LDVTVAARPKPELAAVPRETSPAHLNADQAFTPLLATIEQARTISNLEQPSCHGFTWTA